MKTSYHYFPFIVISLLLHYLFFYFNSDNSSDNSTIKATSSPIKTTEELIVATKLAPKKAMPISLTKLNAIQSISVATSTSPQQTTQTEKVTPSISSGITQTEIESPSSTSQEITKTEIVTPSSTSQETTQTGLIASSTSPKKTQTEQAELAILLPEENEDVKVEKTLPAESYQVNVNTHTSAEVSLLKEYVFERNLVNLPKAKKSKPSKKKEVKKTNIENSTTTSTQAVAVMKNSEITTKTNQQMTTQGTRDFNNKKSTITQQNSTVTAKRVFKPKSDTTNISMVKKGNSLPQAVAVSGKAPVYPEQEALQQHKGQVIANMTVSATGTTKEAEIIQSSGYEMLDKAVLNFIESELFMPTLEGQDRVPSKQSFSYSFE